MGTYTILLLALYYYLTHFGKMNSVTKLLDHWFMKQKLEIQLEIKRLGRPVLEINFSQPNTVKTGVYMPFY